MPHDENSHLLSNFAVAERRRWRSIRVMYLVLFLNSTGRCVLGFSIMLPSMWPYLQHLSPTVSYSVLGFSVAAYSIGQLIGSPLVGKWSTIRGTVTLPLQVTMFVEVLGNMLYALAGILGDRTSPKIALWAVVVGRVMVGLGAGCLALARSYLATVTSLDERTKVVSRGSMAVSIGLIIGPGLSLMTSLIHEGFSYYSWEVSQYTLPAYLSVVMTLANMLIVAIWFREDFTLTELMVSSKSLPLVQTAQLQLTTLKVKWSGVVICNILYYFGMLSFTIIETLNTPILQAELGLTQSAAVQYGSIFLSCVAVFVVLAFVVAAPLGKRFGERTMIGISFILSAVGYTLFYPFGPGYIPYVEWAPLSNVTITNRAVEVTGCSWLNTWCLEQHKLNIVQFIVANCMILFCFPIGTVLTVSRVSKVLGPHPQGTMMGILTGVGSLARAMGPPIFSSLFQSLGPPACVYVLTPALAAASILTFLSKNHLDSYQSRREKLQRSLLS